MSGRRSTRAWRGRAPSDAPGARRNTKLKRLVADLTLDKQILSEVTRKGLKSIRRVELAHRMHERFQVSVRRACRLAKLRNAT